MTETTAWPDVSVVIVTYNRKEALAETLAALKKNVVYSGNLHFIVTDDGSTDGTQAWLAEIYPDAILVQNNRVGMGANSNAGVRAGFEKADYILQMQDDMVLCVALDLQSQIAKLRDDVTAGYIRLWGVAGHNYQGQLEGSHWRVWWHSPELYIPSDRPHLKHRRFHETFGLYPEGLKTAETEDAWCHQCKHIASTGVRLDVMVPLNFLTEDGWEHIGWGNRWRDKGL